MVFGTQALHEPLRLHETSYNLINPKPILNFHDNDALRAIQSAFSKTQVDGAIAIVDEELSRDLLKNVEVNVVALPWSAIGMGILYDLCGAENDHACEYEDVDLILDTSLIAKIFDGDITRWNDPLIAALNPGVALPDEDFFIVSGPQEDDFFHQFVGKLRHCCKSTFNHAAATLQQDTFAKMHNAIFETPFSIGFTPMSTDFPHLAKLARLVNTAGIAVSATAEHLEACAYDTYDIEEHIFALSTSINESCYPFVEAFDILTRQTYLSSENDPDCLTGTQTAYFTEWEADCPAFACAFNWIFGDFAPRHWNS